MGMIINPYLVQPSVPAFSFLLDTYSGAAAAYSAARRLSSTYTGSLIRVRRSSDNTEQDIGYTVGNLLDESALTTFVGAGDGFVTTWYDQSGNAKNATQSTASAQPRIVVSGTINKIGSFPMFETYNKNLFNTQSNTASQSTFATFQIETTGNDSSFILPFLTIDLDTFAGAVSSGSSSSPDSNFGTPSYYGDGSLLTSTRGALYTKFVSGNKKLLSVINGGSTNSNRSLQYTGGVFYGNIKTFEVIIYNTSQSSNRTGIESNINTFYSIY